MSKHLDTTVKDRGNLKTSEKLSTNLLEVHCKMRHRVKDKIINVLAPLIDVPAPTKYPYWFALFLDPRYVMEIKDIKTFHQIENVDNKIIVQNMMPKFYEYIMSE